VKKGILMANRKKIAVIGAGNIGGELAALCCAKELGDVVLLDIPEKESFARGKALDLEQNAAVRGLDASVMGTSNWSDCAGADVVIITAGIPRKPGQSRDDLVAINVPIIRSVADNAARHCPDAFFVVISNPLDVMVHELQRQGGFPKNKVAGMAGILDAGRFQLFIARAAHVSVKDVRAMVLGGHGDDMVPVASATTVYGVPISQLLPADTIRSIVDRTRNGGAEVLKLMGTSAYYAPASSAIAMAEAYLRDQKRLLPCSVFLGGEYGYQDLCMGVPVVIGAAGVERVVEIALTPEEKAMLEKSASSVRALVASAAKPQRAAPSSGFLR
jgi:malate dehydrogenase